MDKKDLSTAGGGVGDQGLMMDMFSDPEKQKQLERLQKRSSTMYKKEKLLLRASGGQRMSGQEAKAGLRKKQAVAAAEKTTSAKPGGYLQKLIATATKHGYTAGDVVSASVYAQGDTPLNDPGGKGMELWSLHQGAALKASGKRTEQINKAGVERDTRGGDAGGGGTTSINTGGNVVSSPTTNYVNNGTAARRPIILQNVGSPF